jgi:hypothetical protein
MKGAHEVARTPVPVMPLATILHRYADGQSIDVMSVDTEAYDLQALTSNDWTQWRPSILLVEDHVPPGGSFEKSEIAEYLKARDYLIVARVHYTSFFVRVDQAATVIR